MKYESNILEKLIKTYGVVGNPKYLSEIIKQFIIQGKECYPNLFTYQSDWLAHIDEFGLTPEYTVSYTGHHIYAPNTKEKPVKRAILKGCTGYRDIDTGEILETFEDGRNLELVSVKMPVLKTSNSITDNLTEYEIIAGRFWNGNDELGCSELVEVDEKGVSFNHTSSSIRGFIIKKIPINNKIGIFTIELTHADKPDGWNGTLYTNINAFKNGSFVKQIGNNAIMNFDSSKNRHYYTFTLNEEYDWVNIALGISQTNNHGIHKFDNILIYNSKYECLMLNRTNILTVNEDVTLRSNGGVYDELNLLTGRLTQRIDENNEVLSQEVIKTVELNIKDQNNQVVNHLTSFEGGTHFDTSSQTGSVLPTLEVDVVVDLEETLMMCSTEGNTM